MKNILLLCAVALVVRLGQVTAAERDIFKEPLPAQQGQLRPLDDASLPPSRWAKKHTAGLVVAGTIVVGFLVSALVVAAGAAGIAKLNNAISINGSTQSLGHITRYDVLSKLQQLQLILKNERNYHVHLKYRTAQTIQEAGITHIGGKSVGENVLFCRWQLVEALGNYIAQEVDRGVELPTGSIIYGSMLWNRMVVPSLSLTGQSKAYVTLNEHCCPQ